uniref:Uncharacterized protein n=1 Tax=Babesia bovis TaxID=5865 RepID=A7AR04_BABBO|eukprot:XP_001610541.1 hypothetical protein [Babesia bovis T2Bo]
MKTHEWKQGSSGRKSGGTDDENVPRDSGVGHGSRYRDFDHKRRGHSDYRDGHYQNSSRRRYEDHTPDGYRRYYDNDDHVRHHRYADRDYYSESRSYRGSRQNHRSYDDDRDDYEESRSYRGGRYEEVTKYRRTVDHYDDRDQYSDRYDRYDRYDGYRHSRRSFSPQTPYSDRRSPNPRKVYYSPPPPPPKEPPAKHAQPSDSAQQKPAKTKGGGNQESGNTGRNAAKNRPESKAAETAEATDDGKIADPRVGRNLYAARMTTALDIVTLPKVPPSESSLDSPPFELGTHWNAIKPGSNFFCTPLERINAYLCSSRCELVQEWWLKGRWD